MPNGSDTQVQGFVQDKARRQQLLDYFMVPKHLALPDPDTLFTTTFDPPDNYVRALNSEEEYKGVLKCLYGESGWAFNYGFSFDFGFFIELCCPGLSLTVAPGASIKVGRVNQLMVIIHRAFPKKLKALSNGRVTRKLSPWRTDRPVSLLTMRGKEVEASLDFNFSVAFGAKIPVFSAISGHGLMINVAEAGFGSGFSYKTYLFEDASPGWYQRGTADDLQQDFIDVVSPGQAQIRTNIKNWLSHLKKKMLPQISDLEERKYVANLLKQPITNSWVREGKLIARRKLPSIEQTRAMLNIISAHLDYLHLRGKFTISVPEKAQLETYFSQIETSLQRGADLDDKRTSSELELSDKRGNQQLSAALKDAYKKLCYATLTVKNYNLNGGGRVGAIVQAGQLGTVPGAPMMLGDVATYTAGAKVDVDGRFFDSRFQEYGLSPNHQKVLVMTQDTSISYLQAKLEGTLLAQLDSTLYADIKKERSASTYLKNEMDYHAVTAYWIYKPGEARAKLRAGSGITFGYSMSTKELFQLGKNIPPTGPLNEAATTSMKKLSEFLTLEKEEFRDFAYQFYQAFPDELSADKFIKDHPVLLVEASFRFTTEHEITIINDTAPRNLIDEYLGGNSKLYAPQRADVKLETIRLRLRLADQSDTSSDFFRLGLYLLGSAFQFGLNHVRRAGNEQLFDIFTYDAKTKSPVSGPELVASNEYRVPPVFLLPHTFQTS